MCLFDKLELSTSPFFLFSVKYIGIPLSPVKTSSSCLSLTRLNLMSRMETDKSVRSVNRSSR